MPGPGGAQHHLPVVQRGPADSGWRGRGSQVWNYRQQPGPSYLAVKAQSHRGSDEGLWPLQLSGGLIACDWPLIVLTLAFLEQATNIWGSSSHQVILVATSKPDVPLGLSVLSTSYNSVSLAWQPGFHGGFQQFFRLRWQRAGTEGFQFDDVFPQGASQFEVTGLQMDTLYSFNIMAFNKLGESLFSADIVQAKTASKLK